MASPARAARRRALRSVGRLERTVRVHLNGQTPTQKFGSGLDQWASANGRRIRIGRTFSLGKWRCVCIFKAVPAEAVAVELHHANTDAGS